MSPTVRAILFDLGGVLVELNHNARNVPWFDRALTPGDNWIKWLTSPLSQKFEQGRLTPEEFAQRYIDENNIQMDRTQFLEVFESWVVGFYPGVFPMLKQLSRDYAIGVFSNTTAVHWPPLYDQMQRQGSITYYFASYQMGMAKPDPASFEHVAEAMKMVPNQILFIDDNPVNVDAARASEFLAEHVSGFDQVPAALDNYGIELRAP